MRSVSYVVILFCYCFEDSPIASQKQDKSLKLGCMFNLLKIRKT